MDTLTSLQWNLIHKLKSIKSMVSASRYVSENSDALAARRAHVSGLSMAVKDPMTGSVYVGRTHQLALANIPVQYAPEFKARLKSQVDEETSYMGFVDSSGDFLSHQEVQARWGVSSQHSIDGLLNETARPRFRA